MKPNLQRDSIVNRLLLDCTNEHNARNANKRKLSIEDIYEMVNSQFTLLEQVFISRDSIRYAGIGKFIIREGRKKFLKECGIEFKSPEKLPEIKGLIFKTKHKEI